MPVRIAFRFFAVAAFAWALAGCATPRAAVEDGTARLMLNSVTIGFDQLIPGNSLIYGVIEGRQRRERISILATDCRQGVGTISFTSGDKPIHNLLLTGDKPADKMFNDLCTIGLPLLAKYFA